MKNRILFALLLVALFSACRKESLDLLGPGEIANQAQTVQTQFRVVWHAVNNGYAFWDLETLDWDSVYHKYDKLFAKYDTQTISTDTLRAYYEEIFDGFHDYHMSVRIKNPKPTSEDVANNQLAFEVSPAISEIKERSYFHTMLISDSVTLKCLDKMKTEGHSVEVKHAHILNPTTGLSLVNALAAKIDGVAYLQLSSYEQPISGIPELLEVFDQFHQWAMEPDIKGVILDNRCNTGGIINNIWFVISPFISNELYVGDVRRKEGLGRYDFTPWMPFVIGPMEGHRTDNVKYVVLADLFSISMGELTTRSVQMLPNGYFIGERTYGAHGPLNNEFSYNYAGIVGDQSLQRTNFYVKTSNDVTRFKEIGIREGLGIEPDYKLFEKENELDAGYDRHIDAALQHILTGKIDIPEDKE